MCPNSAPLLERKGWGRETGLRGNMQDEAEERKGRKETVSLNESLLRKGRARAH